MKEVYYLPSASFFENFFLLIQLISISRLSAKDFLVVIN